MMEEMGFNPVSRIRFKSSKSLQFNSIPSLCFNPVSRIRFKSSFDSGGFLGNADLFQSRFQDSFQIKQYLIDYCYALFEVSIPFPGFVSNQENSALIFLNRVEVSIPFPGFVSNQVRSGETVDFNRIKKVSIPFPGFVSNQVKAAKDIENGSVVSIPFPGFVSNQARKSFVLPVVFRVSIPFPGFVSNQDKFLAI